MATQSDFTTEQKRLKTHLAKGSTASIYKNRTQTSILKTTEVLRDKWTKDVNRKRKTQMINKHVLKGSTPIAIRHPQTNSNTTSAPPYSKLWKMFQTTLEAGQGVPSQPVLGGAPIRTTFPESHLATGSKSLWPRNFSSGKAQARRNKCSIKHWPQNVHPSLQNNWKSSKCPKTEKGNK